MIVTRPRPLLDAAADTTKLYPAISAIVTIAAMAGILTQVQADVVSNVVFITIASVVTIANAVIPMLAAFHVAHIGEPQVTPLSSPMAADGTRLVPESAVAAGGPQSATQGELSAPLAADPGPLVFPLPPGDAGTGQ